MRQSTSAVECPVCGAQGVFTISEGGEAWGVSFRVESEPNGFRERGAAMTRRAFRAECVRC